MSDIPVISVRGVLRICISVVGSAASGIGCSSFNLPFSSDATYLLVSASSPELHFYQFSKSTNLFTEFATVDATMAVDRVNVGKGIVAYGALAGGLGTVVVRGNSVTKLTEVATTPVSGLGVTDDRTAIYWSESDLISTRILTGGTIASSDSQALGVSVSTDHFTHYVSSPDGTTLVTALNAATHGYNLIGFTRNPTTGVLTSAGAGVNEGGGETVTILLTDFSRLGNDIYLYSGEIIMVLARVLGTTTTVLAQLSVASQISGAAIHPTQSWLYTISIDRVLRRYLVSTSALTLASSTSLAAGTTASLFINSSGDRMIEYFANGTVRVYTLGADGAATLTNTSTLIPSIQPMYRIEPSRT